jgi:hypothetical protein
MLTLLDVAVDWSATQWLAVILPTITAIGAVVIGVIGAFRNSAQHVETTKIAASTAVIAEKTVQMEQQGNSRWGIQEAKLADALKEVAELKNVVAQLLPEALAAGIRKAQEMAQKPPHPAVVIDSGKPGEAPPAAKPAGPSAA